nr:ATP-binding protein [Chitinophagales bacterium]
MAEVQYTEENIRSLDWKEHIRLRPGMYIGKLGDGSAPDDGIYVLLKEIIDNSIDEFVMGHGKQIDISIKDKVVTVRDYGRGIPLGAVIDCVSKINTGGKYDSRAFQKSVGLNGVGTKAVNALSSFFKVESFREGETKVAEFDKGELIKDHKIAKTTERNGTKFQFNADNTIFKNFHFVSEFIDEQLWNYAYLNAGLTINFNGNKFVSKDGLKDLLTKKTNEAELRYPIIHLKDTDIEIALTHNS